ncbi:serine hydrolase domain-containing protein [Bacteroidota bacterium]
MKSNILYTLIVITIIFISCEEERTRPEFPKNNNLSSELPTMSPAKQGFNTVELASALNAASSFLNLKSLLIIRNGYIVTEEYYNEYTQDSIHRVSSVTKSVVSALIGKAIEEGYITSENDSIYKYVEPLGYTFSEEKKAITIKHILTMTSGLKWNDQSSENYNAWYNADDKVQFILDLPIEKKPGEVWNYNTPPIHLLSVIITETTGMSTLAYADESLFGPLGIIEREWYQVDDYYYGGSYLYLRARDMAKLGMLFVNEGISGNEEIVSWDWIERTLKITIAQNTGWFWGNISEGNYGYLWWQDTGRIHASFFALGYGGQLIYCVPALDLVVVTTATYNQYTDIAAQENDLIGLVVNYIVPSLIN